MHSATLNRRRNAVAIARPPYGVTSDRSSTSTWVRGSRDTRPPISGHASSSLGTAVTMFTWLARRTSMVGFTSGSLRGRVQGFDNPETVDGGSGFPLCTHAGIAYFRASTPRASLTALSREGHARYRSIPITEMHLRPGAEWLPSPGGTSGSSDSRYLPRPVIAD